MGDGDGEIKDGVGPTELGDGIGVVVVGPNVLGARVTLSADGHLLRYPW